MALTAGTHHLAPEEGPEPPVSVGLMPIRD